MTRVERLRVERVAEALGERVSVLLRRWAEEGMRRDLDRKDAA